MGRLFVYDENMTDERAKITEMCIRDREKPQEREYLPLWK